MQGPNASTEDATERGEPSSRGNISRGRRKSRRSRNPRGKARADGRVGHDVVALTPSASVANIDQNHNPNPQSESQNESTDAVTPDEASTENAPAGPSEIIPYRGADITRHSPNNPVILNLASLNIHHPEDIPPPSGLQEIIGLAEASFAVCPDGTPPVSYLAQIHPYQV